MFTNTKVKDKDTSASTLTALYAGNTFSFNIERKEQLTIPVEFTPGENNAVLEVKIETGTEMTDFHEKVAQNTGTSNITLYQTPYKFTGTTAGTVYKFEIPVNIANIWARVSFKETATIHGTINFAIVTSGEL